MTKYSPDTNAGGKLTAKENVHRLVEKLAQLSLAQNPSDGQDSNAGADEFKDFEDLISWLVQERRKRARHFPLEIAPESAWDILLEVVEAEIEGRHLSVSSVCQASALPATTAARWVDALEQWDLVIRRADQDSAGGDALELTPAAHKALRAYLNDLSDKS